MRKNKQARRYSASVLARVFLILLCLGGLFYLIGFTYPDSFFIRAIGMTLLLAILGAGLSFKTKLRTGLPIFLCVGCIMVFKLFELLDLITLGLIIAVSGVTFYIVRTDQMTESV